MSRTRLRTTLAKSETVSAVVPAKSDIADQRAEAGAIAWDLTMHFLIISFSIRWDVGTVMV